MLVIGAAMVEAVQGQDKGGLWTRSKGSAFEPVSLPLSRHALRARQEQRAEVTLLRRRHEELAAQCMQQELRELRELRDAALQTDQGASD